MLSLSARASAKCALCHCVVVNKNLPVTGFFGKKLQHLTYSSLCDASANLYCSVGVLCKPCFQNVLYKKSVLCWAIIRSTVCLTVAFD